MALIKCKECSKEISDKASSCPNCGCPINYKDIKIEKAKNNKNKKISILDILRYIIGGFVLICSFTSVKGLGIIICLISAILIIPFTATIIYSKVNIPKALKIIIPIICFSFSLGMFPNNINNTTNKSNDNEQLVAICSKNNNNNNIELTIKGNNKETTISGYEKYSSVIIGEQICKYSKTTVKYYGGSIDCYEQANNYIVKYKYERHTDIRDVVNEYEKDDYTCE